MSVTHLHIKHLYVVQVTDILRSGVSNVSSLAASMEYIEQQKKKTDLGIPVTHVDTRGYHQQSTVENTVMQLVVCMLVSTSFLSQLSCMVNAQGSDPGSEDTSGVVFGVIDLCPKQLF